MALKKKTKTTKPAPMKPAPTKPKGKPGRKPKAAPHGDEPSPIMTALKTLQTQLSVVSTKLEQVVMALTPTKPAVDDQHESKEPTSDLGAELDDGPKDGADPADDAEDDAVAEDEEGAEGTDRHGRHGTDD